jgi:hypothetical protein
VKRLITICILAFLSSFPLTAQHIFAWQMDVQEIAFDGHSYETKDTLVVWGMKGDTVCFRFNYQLQCFYNVSKTAWYKHNDSTRLEIAYHMDQLSEFGKRYYQHHTAVLKQDGHDELYTVQFIYNDSSVVILITNLVYGIPTYRFQYNAKCKNCIDK